MKSYSYCSTNKKPLPFGLGFLYIEVVSNNMIQSKHTHRKKARRSKEIVSFHAHFPVMFLLTKEEKTTLLYLIEERIKSDSKNALLVRNLVAIQSKVSFFPTTGG